MRKKYGHLGVIPLEGEVVEILGDEIVAGIGGDRIDERRSAMHHEVFQLVGHFNEMDIALAAQLALPHRIKRGPFHQAEITMEQLTERISDLQSQMVGEGEETEQPGEERQEKDAPEKKKMK